MRFEEFNCSPYSTSNPLFCFNFTNKVVLKNPHNNIIGHPILSFIFNYLQLQSGCHSLSHFMYTVLYMAYVEYIINMSSINI